MIYRIRGSANLFELSMHGMQGDCVSLQLLYRPQRRATLPNSSLNGTEMRLYAPIR